MKEHSALDKLFRIGHAKNYPYSEGLWKQMSTQLDAAAPIKAKRGIIGYGVDLILILLAVSIFGWINMDTKPASETPSSSIIDSEFNANTLAERQKLNNDKSDNSFDIPIIPNENNKVDNDVGGNELGLNEPRLQHNLVLKTLIEHEAMPERVIKEDDNSRYSFFGLGMVSPPYKSIHQFDLEFNNSHNLDKARPSKTIRAKRFGFIQIEATSSVYCGKQIKGLPEATKFYRLKNEQLSNSGSATVLLGVKNQLIFAQTGIGKRWYHESVEYQIKQTSFTVSEGPLSILDENFNKDGRLVTLIGHKKDTTWVLDSLSINHKGRNTYSYLSIPLRIGSYKRIGRISFSGWLGSEVLLLQKFQGSYIGNDLTTVNEVKASSDLNKIGLNVGMGLAAEYMLRSKLVIGTTAQWHQMQRSTHKSFTHKYQTLGLGAYIKISL